MVSKQANPTTVSPRQAQDFLCQLLKSEPTAVPPVCLWGVHGIGKTAMVQEVAKQLSWSFQAISPAQLEEMGDLMGLPYLASDSGEKRTRFAPPNWIPTTDEPGILLIDDFNRADDRIIRGLMPLLQFKAIAGWQLPSKWRIVLTANPENLHYSVTPIDEAVRSRMLHLQVDFELTSWLDWAKSEGLPEKGITFVKHYPHIFDDGQTTPRTWTYFLRLWKQHSQILPPNPFLSTLANSALAPKTAMQFLAFLANNQLVIPAVKTVFQSKTKPPLANWLKDMQAHNPQRMDLIQLFCTDLLRYLNETQALSAKDTQRLEQFLVQDALPTDIRLLFLRQLSDKAHPALQTLLKNRALSDWLLS